LPRDVDLAPATSALRAGAGIPKGPGHELVRDAVPAEVDELQVRFTAFFPWTREMPCRQTFRYRWGKRWLSEARADDTVFLATELAQKPRTPELLAAALRVPLLELGFDAARLDAATGAKARSVPPAASGPAKSAASVPSRSSRGCGCTITGRQGSREGLLVILVLVLARLARGVRRRASSSHF
jgi:hypothetical protein